MKLDLSTVSICADKHAEVRQLSLSCMTTGLESQPDMIAECSDILAAYL